MEIVKNINLGLRFILELCLVYALGYSGFHLTQGTLFKWLFAILLPTITVVIWSLFIAPKASHLLDPPKRITVELLLFGAAVALLFAIGHTTAALVLGAAVLLNEVLLVAWK